MNLKKKCNINLKMIIYVYLWIGQNNGSNEFD